MALTDQFYRAEAEKSCPWLNGEQLEEIAEFHSVYNLHRVDTSKCEMSRTKDCSGFGLIPSRDVEFVKSACQFVGSVSFDSTGHVGVQIQDDLFLTPKGLVVCMTHGICTGIRTIRLLYNRKAVELAAGGADAVLAFCSQNGLAMGKQ